MNNSKDSTIDINYIQLQESKMNKPEYDWQLLDEVTRKWAVQSQFEKDLKDYAGLASRVE